MTSTAPVLRAGLLSALGSLVERLLAAHGIVYEVTRKDCLTEIRSERVVARFSADGGFSVSFRDGTELRGAGLVVEEGVATVKVSEGGLSFDYAHFLPHIEKCSTLHGHTATVSVDVTGPKRTEGYVMDFGVLKRLVKSVIDELDHRIVISPKYVRDVRDGRYLISFDGLGGSYDLWVPQSRVALIEGDSTVENISAHIARRLIESIPVRPVLVRVTVSEGVGKYAVAELLR
ncbi:MAG: 6-carboxytetrahydropterin synthase [Nitrososphaerota archaeon]